MDLSKLPIKDDYALLLIKKQIKIQKAIKLRKHIPSLKINRVFQVINESYNFNPDNYIKLKNYKQIYSFSPSIIYSLQAPQNKKDI